MHLSDHFRLLNCLYSCTKLNEREKKNVEFKISVFSRDSAQPDGIRASALSVASTAIAAAQWSSSQVSGRFFFCFFLKLEFIQDFFLKCNLNLSENSVKRARNC